MLFFYIVFASSLAEAVVMQYNACQIIYVEIVETNIVSFFRNGPLGKLLMCAV